MSRRQPGPDLEDLPRAAPGGRRHLADLPGGGQLRRQLTGVVPPVPGSRQDRSPRTTRPGAEVRRDGSRTTRRNDQLPHGLLAGRAARRSPSTRTGCRPPARSTSPPSSRPSPPTPTSGRKTAFILTYDENDGYFDHVPPPKPPAGTPGRVRAAGCRSARGFRVPDDHRLAVVGRAATSCSETFDHTSLIRFLERRFGVREPNISAWRRRIIGDLTSAFRFAAGSKHYPRRPEPRLPLGDPRPGQGAAAGAEQPSPGATGNDGQTRRATDQAAEGRPGSLGLPKVMCNQWLRMRDECRTVMCNQRLR